MKSLADTIKPEQTIKLTNIEVEYVLSALLLCEKKFILGESGKIYGLMREKITEQLVKNE